MSFEKVLLETPAGKRFIDQKVAEIKRRLEEEAARKAEEAARETARNAVLRTLRRRFGPVPEDLAGQLGAIQAPPQLEDLLDLAIVCPDLEAFRQALSLP